MWYITCWSWGSYISHLSNTFVTLYSSWSLWSYKRKVTLSDTWQLNPEQWLNCDTKKTKQTNKKITWKSLPSWPSLPANLPWMSRSTWRSRVTRGTIFPWGSWSTRWCHHLYWHLHARHVIGHSLWKNKTIIQINVSQKQKTVVS